MSQQNVLALKIMTPVPLVGRILVVSSVFFAVQGFSGVVGEVAESTSTIASATEVIPGISSLFQSIVATELSISSAAPSLSNSGSTPKTVATAESTTLGNSPSSGAADPGTKTTQGSVEAPPIPKLSNLGEVSPITVTDSTPSSSESPLDISRGNIGFGANLDVMEKSLKPLNDVGRLPLPIAQVNPSGQTTFIQNFKGTPDQLSDMGNKSAVTFGSSDAAASDSFMASKPKAASKGSNAKGSNGANNKKEDKESKEEKEKKEKEMRENLAKSIDAFVDRTNPFDRDDLSAYRAARDTFFASPESSEMVGELIKEDPRITQKLGELFGTFSPKDRESDRQSAKKAYEDFLRNPEQAIRGRIESEPASSPTRPHIVDRPERFQGGPRSPSLEQSPHQDN